MNFEVCGDFPALCSERRLFRSDVTPTYRRGSAVVFSNKYT
jgi:hypothetical protein